MPRTPAANEAVKARTRARVMDHALRLFAQHGYDGTSVKMIAESCGMAQGLLYRHFESKDHLLRAIFEQSMVDVQASFSIAQQSEDPLDRIEGLIRAAAAIVTRNQRFWKLSYGVRMQHGVLKALGPRLSGWTRAIESTLHGYLKEAGARKPRLEASILFALIDGMSQHFVLDPDNYPLEDVVDAVVKQYRQRLGRKQ